MIRLYQPSDVGRIVDIWDAATRLAHPFMMSDFLAAERRNLTELYLPNTETWVVEDEGQVVGFVAMIGAEIGGLFVDPESWRRGFGADLVQRMHEEKGDLEVEVFEANPIGRAFYARRGFEEIGRSVHPPTGEPVLRLRLASRV